MPFLIGTVEVVLPPATEINGLTGACELYGRLRHRQAGFADSDFIKLL
jgi:hypothetical protein